MDKEVVVHMHNGILLSCKKEHIWVSSNVVDETGVYLQSEVSQKEKHQYSTLKHIYGIEKAGNDNPVCKTAKQTQM